MENKDIQEKKLKPHPFRGKSKPQKNLTPEQWGMIRHLWSINEGYTFDKLAKEFGISIQTIKRRSVIEQWRIRKIEIRKKIDESMEDMFIRLGMPKEEYVQMIIDGARNTKKLANVKDIAKKKNMRGEEEVITTMKGVPVTIEKTVHVADNDNLIKYRQEIAKLCGYYAPLKHKVSTYEDLDDDELERRIQDRFDRINGLMQREREETL